MGSVQQLMAHMLWCGWGPGLGLLESFYSYAHNLFLQKTTLTRTNANLLISDGENDRQRLRRWKISIMCWSFGCMAFSGDLCPDLCFCRYVTARYI